MSRIGKLPVPLPKGVKVEWKEPTISVANGGKVLTRKLHPSVEVTVSDDRLSVRPKVETPSSRAIWGLSRTLVNNMVLGVSTGFTKVLEVVGVGWRVESVDDETLRLSLGFSHPIIFKLPKGVEAKVDAKTFKITLSSADKELLGLTAARIRAYRKPEPYKGKGVKYENERIIRKGGGK
jgi:large subunit ribosomal protein L6